MDLILGGLALFCLFAARLGAVVVVHDSRWEGKARDPQDLPDEVRTRYLLNFG